MDLSYLQQFTRGDKEKLKKYLNMYLNSAPLVIGEFRDLLDHQNYETLMLKAHSIKPQAQYLGIENLRELLLQIETIIKNKGDHTKLPELVEQSEQISDEVKLEIIDFLAG